jgi:threonine synthase
MSMPAAKVPAGAREWLECVACGATYDVDALRYSCTCGGLLSVERPPGWAARIGPALFDSRLASRADVDRSGVWRFREAVRDLPAAELVTHPEGATRLYARPALSSWAGIERLLFKHEGENPTGSFKDRGMVVGITQAVRVGARAVACASTGNTSSSLAAYAAQVGRPAIVFLPAGKVATGKVAQTLAYGARGLAVRGDFDAALRLVTECCQRLGIYLLNSVNPFRIEGRRRSCGRCCRTWLGRPGLDRGARREPRQHERVREGAARSARRRLDRAPAAPPGRAGEGREPVLPQLRRRFPFAPSRAAGDGGHRDPHRRSGEPRPRAHRDRDDARRGGRGVRRGDPGGQGARRRGGPGLRARLRGQPGRRRKLRAEGVIAPGERVVCVLTGNLLKDPDAILARSPERALVEVDAEPAAVEAAIAPWLR